MTTSLIQLLTVLIQSNTVVDCVNIVLNCSDKVINTVNNYNFEDADPEVVAAEVVAAAAFVNLQLPLLFCNFMGGILCYLSSINL
jgi:hypothetical protein